MSATQTAQIVAFPEVQVGLKDAFIRGLPSAATRKVYRQALDAFELFIGSDILAVTRRDVEAYRAHLEQQGRAPATVTKVMSALSSFHGFAVAEGVIDRNPTASARRPKVPDVSPRRALSQAEVRALVAAADVSTMIGLRDRALLVTLAVQGWRISEALGLKVEDLAEEGGHRVATITGKGNKIARVPLAAATWSAIQDWIGQAGIVVGPVFTAVNKGGEVVHVEAVSPQSAWKRLGLLARRAGIGRALHPHLLRHTAVTHALAAGVALHQVQDFARHADPRTTRRYDSHRNSLNNPAPHVLAASLGDPGA